MVPKTVVLDPMTPSCRFPSERYCGGRPCSTSYPGRNQDHRGVPPLTAGMGPVQQSSERRSPLVVYELSGGVDGVIPLLAEYPIQGTTKGGIPRRMSS